MQLVRRTAPVIAAAAVAPLLVFGVLQVSFGIQAERRDAEREAMVRARDVNARVDGLLMSDEGALSVLASSRLFQSGDLLGARERVAAVAATRPAWKNVALVDAKTGRELWRTQGPTAEGPAEKDAAAFKIDGMGAASCPCVRLHQPIHVRGVKTYVLTLERATDDFQAILVDAAARGEVAAIVDRSGVFVARTIAFEEKRGTPATIYVRDAIRKGARGLYEGVTYEGLRNHTAFETSSLSGWSTHIAVPSTRLAVLDAGWIGLTLLAAGVSLVFAVLIAWAAIRDLRRRRLEEARSVRSQKLEAIGQFAGGVAHDFNNLLTVILGGVRVLERTPLDEKAQRALGHVRAAAQRGERVTAQLLAFARSKPLELTCVDISAAVAGVRDLLAQSLGPDTALECQIAEDARWATTNAAQLELALLNLAVNARDAMPEGGTFTVRTERGADGAFVDIVVRDTGIGMTKEVAAQAVEPFFTTKAEGKGTGLGLAQVQRLAQQSGGTLEITSAPGEGAEFRLRLPACAPA